MEKMESDSSSENNEQEDPFFQFDWNHANQWEKETYQKMPSFSELDTKIKQFLEEGRIEEAKWLFGKWETARNFATIKYDEKQIPNESALRNELHTLIKEKEWDRLNKEKYGNDAVTKDECKAAYETAKKVWNSIRVNRKGSINSFEDQQIQHILDNISTAGSKEYLKTLQNMLNVHCKDHGLPSGELLPGLLNPEEFVTAEDSIQHLEKGMSDIRSQIEEIQKLFSTKDTSITPEIRDILVSLSPGGNTDEAINTIRNVLSRLSYELFQKRDKR